LIDRNDATPLYHQLFLKLRDEIVTGRCAFGENMPTEAELSERHGVSRVTARRALDELSISGLVERRRRTGTRVIYQAPTQPLEADIDQAVESLLAFGRKTAVRLIALTEGPATPDVARSLQLRDGAPVVHAQRLRSLDGQPLGQVSSWMPAAIAAHVPLAGLATTPILALLRDSGLAIGSAWQTIGAEIADTALATLLDIPPRSAILWIERVVRGSDGAPILLTRAHYRADRYRVTLDLGSSGELVAPRLSDQPSAPDPRNAEISSAE
jgi:GntR family transcriptional regulator